MKKLALLTALLLLCMAMLAACGGNPTTTPPPGPGPDGPSDGKTTYRMADDFPTAAGTVEDGVWGYYVVSSGSTAKGDYTALTTVADQAALGALGLSDGNGALASGSAIAAAGKDVAYGFTAPRDGVVTLTSETLVRENGGTAAVSVYKNGVRIWPLAVSSYAVPTAEKASMLAIDTAVKAGDTIFFRVSAENGSAAKLKLSPVVNYSTAAYTAEADLEQTRPTINGIAGAGATLEAGSLAAAGRTPGAVTELSGFDFSKAFTRGNLVEGTTYRITDTEPLTINLSRDEYDGLNCIVYAPAGMIFSAHGDLRFTNISVLDGPVTISARDITLANVEVTGGLTITEGSKGVRMDNCRLIAKDTTAFTNQSESLTAVGCYFEGVTAASDAAVDGALYENCVFKGEEVAIVLSTGNSTVWYSTIRGDVTTGKEKTQNLLVAMNRFENLGGVSYDGTHNSVILLNEVERVTVKNSTNAYICSNDLYGDMVLDGVNYLLATRNNAFGKVEKANLKNFNGDNVTDVNARTEYGVNEELLPHINKDAFINMERKDYVRLADGSKQLINEYINQRSKNGGMLIIAPGAYSTTGRIQLKEIKNCTVYAYGVLYEKYDCLGDVFNITRCENYSIRGMMVDMVINGCGQLIVLSKSNGVVSYRVAAGLFKDPTNTKYYKDGGGNGISYMGYHAGEAFPYADISLGHLTYNKSSQMITSSPSQSVYNMIEPGDIVTCRANGGNVANLYENTAMHFEDVTILSGSVRCFWDSYAVEGTILNRCMVSPAPAKVIDKAMYEEYKALNERYGIDTLVYIDDFGNYRGTPMRTVTADSTHTSNSLTGMKATSCIFEGLSDDGTNQQGFHGRLAGYDPETGTITYKKRISSLGYVSVCANFAVGDRVYVYTSAGKTVCDTPALSVTKQLSEINGYMHYEVKVDPTAFDHSILSTYDLAADGANDRRILIDNRTRNGDGFIFDNMLIQNIRSRGFLVKCADNEIKHCTFRGIGMAAIGLIFEPEWGESGVCDNTLIAYNYIENTGYFTNQTLYSPIVIKGLNNSSAEEDYLPYKNIQIIGNVIRNRATDYALYINSAMDVLVKDNDFGDMGDLDNLTSTSSVFVNFARNVTFENNKYSDFAMDITESIIVNGNINMNGSDINGALPDDPIMSVSKHSTSFNENQPTTDADGFLVHHGAWRAGYTNTTDIFSFRPFKIITESGWYTENEGSLWSTSGGMDPTRDYRTAALQNSNIAIQYVAEYSGDVALRIGSYVPPFASGSGSGDGYFAIFVNDKMVWPTNDGSYQNGNDWRLITQNTTETMLNDSLAVLALQLEEGDVVSFVAKRHEEWSGFGVTPFVHYLSIKE